MKKMIFSLFAVAMVAVAGVNVYKVGVSEVAMSDLQKENVEALAALVEKKQGYLCCTSCDGECNYGRGDVIKGKFQY